MKRGLVSRSTLSAYSLDRIFRKFARRTSFAAAGKIGPEQWHLPKHVPHKVSTQQAAPSKQGYLATPAHSHRAAEKWENSGTDRYQNLKVLTGRPEIRPATSRCRHGIPALGTSYKIKLKNIIYICFHDFRTFSACQSPWIRQFQS